MEEAAAPADDRLTGEWGRLLEVELVRRPDLVRLLEDVEPAARHDPERLPVPVQRVPAEGEPAREAVRLLVVHAQLGELQGVRDRPEGRKRVRAVRVLLR